MSQNNFNRLFLITTLCFAVMCGCSKAAGTVTTSGPGAILKALAKYFGKESIEAATEQVAKVGGRELYERAAQKVFAEGGEVLAERTATLTLKHGPDVLRAIDNSPLPTARLLNALDELPVEKIPAASSRLAAGTAGKEVAESVGKYGSNALRTELAHPGIGPKLIRTFGNEGAELVIGLSDDYAVALARHSEDLAQLPGPQRAAVMELIKKNEDGFFRWLGNFVEKNPGKVVFTTATTTVVIANGERLFGGDEIVFDANGNPIVVSKPGLAGRGLEAGKEIVGKPISNFLNTAGIVVASALGLVALAGIFWVYRRSQISLHESKIKSEKRLEALNDSGQVSESDN